MASRWKYWVHDQCDICGNAIEVYVDKWCAEDELGDGDKARCLGCRADGSVTVDEDGSVLIDWD